jgi:ATP-dependent Lhr-like helicase
VAAHHGSLAKEHRLDAEQRLKRRRAWSPPRRWSWASISAMSTGLPDRLAALDRRLPATRRPLRAPGRRHAQGRLFATTRDDLIECAALLDCVRRGELDTLHIEAPLDVRRSRSSPKSVVSGLEERAAGAVPPLALRRLDETTIRRC